MPDETRVDLGGGMVVPLSELLDAEDEAGCVACDTHDLCEEHDVCGETYDHDLVLIFEDEDVRQSECRNCEAELIEFTDDRSVTTLEGTFPL